MNFNLKIGLALIATSVLLLNSCKKNDPVIPNEEELISSLKYTLTPVGGGDVVELIFQDLDGDGGDPPFISEGILDANKNYTGSLEHLNETTTPETDITVEIKEEGEDHQFFFNVSDNLKLTINYDDQDSNGNPVGLATNISTIDASEGQLTIVLRHEPVKTAPGVADGDITNASGETDIEVTFNLTIQ